MKLKLLFILPMVLCSGILLGHLMLALAWSSSSQPDPGHPASQIGGDNDADRTFYDPGKYFFKGELGINSNANRYARLDINTKNSADQGGALWSIWADADNSIIGNRLWALWGYPKNAAGGIIASESFITAEFPTLSGTTYTKKITLSADTTVNGKIRTSANRFAATYIVPGDVYWFQVNGDSEANDVLGIYSDSSGNDKKVIVGGTTITEGLVGPRVQIITSPDETHDDYDHIAECPNGYAMAGVSVKITQSGSVNYWDGYLSAKCVDITGALDTTVSAWNTETNGESGGKINSCSPGYVATGIQGHTGYFLKTFRLKCTKIKVNFEQLTRASYKAESERVNKNQLEKGYYCIPGTFMRSLSFSIFDAATGFRDDDNNYIACTSIYP